VGRCYSIITPFQTSRSRLYIVWDVIAVDHILRLEQTAGIYSTCDDNCGTVVKSDSKADCMGVDNSVATETLL
jgi:hypothetical protein